ncbi:MAG TPA: HlyD family efflux transporter periplasmic adaptor subunit [Candidatus Binatia bacterium]|jgi:HlyD family secretion protein|nr:HlyD family efflux transporter periplasmic adaptor subunit [Candidatus Binatia bacterium]
MKRAVLVVALIGGLVLAGGLIWWITQRAHEAPELMLHGNVDLRQVELAFNNSERIAAVLVQEGDRVQRGQVLARLDTSRLAPQLAQVEAQAAAQRQVVQRLRTGSRPEEIAQARANVESARADAANARAQYERWRSAAEISGGRAVRQQDVDNAKTALQVAEAKLVVNQRALELAVAGPRKEDVAENEARLRGSEAQATLLRQQLADSQLVAPMDAMVRTRVMEPGEMASPQKTVFALAITDPKWVRVYVSEPDLGKVRSGMAASVVVDSFPKRRFEGWIGFISPVAEFTPKSVQTEELRSSLVYEVRVFVKDPADELRLGMPASAYVSLQQKAPTATAADAQTTKEPAANNR